MGILEPVGAETYLLKIIMTLPALIRRKSVRHLLLQIFFPKWKSVCRCETLSKLYRLHLKPRLTNLNICAKSATDPANKDEVVNHLQQATGLFSENGLTLCWPNNYCGNVGQMLLAASYPSMEAIEKLICTEWSKYLRIVSTIDVNRREFIRLLVARRTT